MIKQRLLSLAVTTMLTAAVLMPGEMRAQSVEINETNFPDPAFREFLLNYYNDGNNCLSETAKRVDELDLSYNDIKDLTGIEHFSGVHQLDCSHCLLTKLDLSKNAYLRDLWAGSNQLTSLNLAGTEAERVWIQFNQLRGEAMDALISSLRTVENGSIYVMAFYDDKEDGNLCTLEQYRALTAKGWTVFIEDHGTSYGYEDWVAQHGELSAIRTATPRTAASAAVYDLQGRQLNGLSVGISIIRKGTRETKKVINHK